MRTMIVVVLGVFGEDLGQMPSPKMSVRSSTSRRSVPTTRSPDRVRPWCLWWGLDDPEAVGSEDLVEGRDELGVPITGQPEYGPSG
jgi:hypothetical protein